MCICKAEAWDSIGGELGNCLQRLVPHVNCKHPCLFVLVVNFCHEVNNSTVVQAECGMACLEPHQGWLGYAFKVHQFFSDSDLRGVEFVVLVPTVPMPRTSSTGAPYGNGPAIRDVAAPAGRTWHGSDLQLDVVDATINDRDVASVPGAASQLPCWQ